MFSVTERPHKSLKSPCSGLILLGMLTHFTASLRSLTNRQPASTLAGGQDIDVMSSMVGEREEDEQCESYEGETIFQQEFAALRAPMVW